MNSLKVFLSPALFLLCCAWAHAADIKPNPMTLGWQVVAAGSGLERDLVVTLRDQNGSPVVGAEVAVSVDMPSMPMAHKIPKTMAKPDGPPGRYVARVTLEMPGQWAAKIDVMKPQRESYVRKFAVQ